jgi:hypothetical protein
MYSYAAVRELLCIGCSLDGFGILRCSKTVKFQACCGVKSSIKIKEAIPYIGVTAINGELIPKYTVDPDKVYTKSDIPSLILNMVDNIQTKYHYLYNGKYVFDNTINYGEL